MMFESSVWPAMPQKCHVLRSYFRWSRPSLHANNGTAASCELADGVSGLSLSLTWTGRGPQLWHSGYSNSRSRCIIGSEWILLSLASDVCKAQNLLGTDCQCWQLEQFTPHVHSWPQDQHKGSWGGPDCHVWACWNEAKRQHLPFWVLLVHENFYGAHGPCESGQDLMVLKCGQFEHRVKLITKSYCTSGCVPTKLLQHSRSNYPTLLNRQCLGAWPRPEARAWCCWLIVRYRWINENGRKPCDCTWRKLVRGSKAVNRQAERAPIILQ